MMAPNSIDNPWKDIVAYSIHDAYRFKGREEDIIRFLRIIDSGTMSVLYAYSGIGKTSFINAGISYKMLEMDYYPIHIVFPDDVFEKEDIESFIYSSLLDSVNNNPNNELPICSWEPIYKTNHDRNEDVLWWLLHTYKLRDHQTGRIYKPFIIFDQFEEVFTKSRKFSSTRFLESLFNTISKLCSTSIPLDIEEFLEDLYKKGNDLDIDNNKNYKIVFSLRKEFLSDFDYWTNDRFRISELYQNRMYLLPLTRIQAERVITQQPKSKVNPETIGTLFSIKNEIISKIDPKGRDEVEPFILSVLCSKLYNKAQEKQGSALQKSDITFNIDTIIREFYETSINKVIDNKSHVKRFEELLVDKDGYRNRIKIKALSDIYFDRNYREGLERLHLIRIDNYNDEDYVELIHDRIADAIKERKVQAKVRKRIWLWAYFWGVLLLISIAYTVFINMKSPAKPTLYSANITEFTNLALYSSDTTVFKGRNEKGVLRNNHIAEIFIINDTTSFNIDNCSYLKEIQITNKKARNIELYINNCPLLQAVALPDSIKEISLGINNCPNVKVPIGPNIQKIKFWATGGNNDISLIVNNDKLLWERVYAYNKEKSLKDSIGNHNYALWDRTTGELLYAQSDVPDTIFYPIQSSSHMQTLNGKKYYNAYYINNHSGVNFLQVDTISNKTIRYEDPGNYDAESIYLTDSVEYISIGAFQKYKKLKSIRFSPNINTINSYAFRGCERLDSLYLPAKLEYIGKSAFEGCKNLRFVSFNSSNKVYLGPSCFARCDMLNYVILSDSINTYNGSYGSLFFENPFWECRNLHNIELRNPERSNLYCGVNTIFSKLDSLPRFYLDNNIEFNKTYKNGRFYSVNGSVIYKYGDGYKNIEHLSQYEQLKESSYYNENGVYFIKDDENGYIINYHTPKTLYYPAKFGRQKTSFIFPPDSLESIYLYYAQPSSHVYELSFDIPDSIAHKIRLIVPHGSSKYYLTNPNFSRFKSVEEETFFNTVCNTIKLYSESTNSYLGSHKWGLFALVGLPLLFLCILFYCKKSYLKHNNKKLKNGYIFASSIITVALSLFIYTISFWFFVGIGLRNYLLSNIFAFIMGISLSLVIMMGRNKILYLFDMVSLLINNQRENLYSTLRTIKTNCKEDAYKNKLINEFKNGIIVISAISLFVIMWMSRQEATNLQYAIKNGYTERALDLIYKQVLNEDSIDANMKEQLRNLLVSAKAFSWQKDSMQIIGKDIHLDESNGYLRYQRGDSTIVLDLKNGGRYAAIGSYSVSPQGTFLYKNTERGRLFVKTDNILDSIIIKESKEKDPFPNLLYNEQFIVVTSDTALWIYDTNKDFSCRTLDVHNKDVVLDNNSNRYVGVCYKADNAFKTKVLDLKENEEYAFETNSYPLDFIEDKIIMQHEDSMFFMSIKDYKRTQIYYGIYSCLSYDRSSRLFTCDNERIYWYGLNKENNVNGSVSRKEVGLKDGLRYSSVAFSNLQRANNKVLQYINDNGYVGKDGKVACVIKDKIIYFNDYNCYTTIVDCNKPWTPISFPHSSYELYETDNNLYLLVYNNREYKMSDTLSIHDASDLSIIINGNYDTYNVCSDYVITGNYSEPKKIKSLIYKDEDPYILNVIGSAYYNMIIYGGWLYADNNGSFTLYNIQPLKELISNYSKWDKRKRDKLIEILNKSKM